MVYRMFFLSRNFLSCLIYKLKSKKNEKLFQKLCFFQPWMCLIAIIVHSKLTLQVHVYSACVCV